MDKTQHIPQSSLTVVAPVLYHIGLSWTTPHNLVVVFVLRQLTHMDSFLWFLIKCTAQHRHNFGVSCYRHMENLGWSAVFPFLSSSWSASTSPVTAAWINGSLLYA